VSEESIRDRLASLSRREIVGLVLIVAATLAGGIVWYVRSLPRPVTIAERTGGSAGFAPVAAPTASASPASLFVDVAGAVRHPGVYEFQDGDRVIDAIDAAGGQKPGATLDALNLAAPLADGAQVLVPGRAPRTQIPANGASALPSGGTGTIDVNTADATELQELPGIGEVLSQAIIDYRTKNGPFTSVDQLEDVSGIGPTTLADIRDLVTV
jgi:competence protein ComEA